MAVTSRPTVLVLRALGLGDLLTAVPALRALRRAHGDARIVLAASLDLAGLLPLIGAVDALWHTADMRSLHWTGQAPELAVNLHGSGPESIDALRATGATTVLTHAHPRHADLEGPQWTEQVHEVTRWCELLRYYGIAANPQDLALSPNGSISPRKGSVLLHPGASHEARRWPPDRFASVARELASSGYQVTITGSRGERCLAEEVADAARLPRSAVLAGRTRLPELAALVSTSELVVCGDTGLGHLATACGTPSVLLFGPVSPQRWGPPPDRTRHVVLWNGTTGDTFADRPDPGLLALPAGRVLEAAFDALGAGR